MTMKLDFNNITLNYQKIGSGNPLILLHGNGEDLHIFDKLVESLKQFFTIYAIDSRNHGQSSQTEDYSYNTMAKDIFQFIETLNLRNVSIVGFSDGAIIALLMSIENSSIFSKMVLLGVNLKPSDFKENIYQYLVGEYQKEKSPLIKMMLEEPNIELEQLENINIPTLVVAGEDDLFKIESFEKMKKSFPDCIFKIMYGYDHSSYIVNNDILNADLIQFLENGDV